MNATTTDARAEPAVPAARTRDAGSTRPSRAEQMPRFLQSIGAEIGPQQSELDQVVLRAATANALVFPYQWRKHLYRAGKISAFERRESTGQCGKIRARRVAPFSRQYLDLTSTRVELGFAAHDRLRQNDVQIGEPAARSWQ